jgi:hypothetical protein
MAMTHPVQPILHPVKILDLRPTQMTVGVREVSAKRDEWRNRPRDSEGKYLGSHMIPAVIGPKGRPWIIDHHHLALAMHMEGVEHVLVSVIAKLGHLPKKRFMAFMDAHNWLHAYDENGKHCDFDDIPRKLTDLADDPYRSLAGEVRRSGGYAKSAVPYTEFLWADFFRTVIDRDHLDHDFDKCVSAAVPLAHGPDAQYLPGWAGVDPQG